MADAQKISTMLMFTGEAEEAMTFYGGLFDDFAIEFLQRYGDDYPGPEGQVVHARFRLAGQSFLSMDSAVPQDWRFNPRISFFVACTSASLIPATI